MKKYITILTIAATAAWANAQVAVEKATVSNTSVILEFNDEASGGLAKGLILPILSDASAVVEGSVYFDTADGVMKVMSADGADALTEANTAVAAPTLAEIGEGTIIGDETTAPEGVLVLEATDKAMVLPRVSVENISDPAVGTFVYDTTRKALAFFNGTQWEFRYGR